MIQLLSIDLAFETAEYYGLTLSDAKNMAKEVAKNCKVVGVKWQILME